MLLLVLVYILACILCAWIAVEKGRSGFAWALVAFIFSPIIGLIGLAAVPEKTKDDRKRSSQSLGFYGMKY